MSPLQNQVAEPRVCERSQNRFTKNSHSHAGSLEEETKSSCGSRLSRWVSYLTKICVLVLLVELCIDPTWTNTVTVPEHVLTWTLHTGTMIKVKRRRGIVYNLTKNCQKKLKCASKRSSSWLVAAPYLCSLFMRARTHGANRWVGLGSGFGRGETVVCRLHLRVRVLCM